MTLYRRGGDHHPVPSYYTHKIRELESRVEQLTDAIWEYGDHRKSCRIAAGKECDCGFFDIIKTLEPK